MAAPPIQLRPLEYECRLAQRSLANIELVVIHCTELPDLDMAREWAERIHYQQSATGNSGHYYIDRDGTVCQYVGLDRVAHHTRGLNGESVGIELVNSGRYPHWYRSDRQQMTEPYPENQIDSLLALLVDLCDRLPNLATIAGHNMLDQTQMISDDDPGRSVSRKVDPGPLFPWSKVISGASLKIMT